MLQINCPWCGTRAEIEFTCGGEGGIVRPLNSEAMDDREWGDSVFMGENPKGLHHEQWRHSAGCGRWFNLRLSAYRSHPVKLSDDGGARWERVETFDCLALCRRQETDQYDDDERAARCCGLAGFDAHRWRPDAERLVQVHMGAPARYDREGQDPSWRRPAEDVGEGCPGSWYRSAFVDFVLQYRRRPTEGGGRVENTRLTRCDDRLVHEWIALLESYEDAAHGEFLAKASGR